MISLCFKSCIQPFLLEFAVHFSFLRASCTALFFSTLTLFVTSSHAALPQDSRHAGGIAVIEVAPDTKAANLEENPVALVIENGKTYAIVGIPISATTGTHTLTTDHGNIDFNVSDYAYPEQHITLKDTSKVNPDPEQLARYQREAVEQNNIYKSFTPIQTNSFPQFIWPAHGRISSPFGFKRFFNEEPRAPHAGIDIAAGLGTVAHAPASGVVVQTGDYFFNGQTVMIDHGQGIISMLCHLSRIDVKIGQSIAQGDPIGLVGMTGRATGPHLHFGVSLNNTRVDPMLVLPADSARP
ncbi:MAG: M23 family metallopeptidase [Gammaproteobacteria bacterium]|nr:M23 family metallopeptidase [Gammaproteobacteria bacterium]